MKTQKPLCYIIYSKSLDKYYIGATQDNFSARLQKHNNIGYSNKSFTAKANDWEIYLEIEAESYPHAIRIERFIKSMKSRKFIERLKFEVDLKENIIKRFSVG